MTNAVDFKALPAAYGSVPLTIDFIDLSATTNTILTWEWDFGDGTVSAAQNPTHPYVAPGTYTVSLKVAFSGFDTSPITVSRTDFIHALTVIAPLVTNCVPDPYHNGPSPITSLMLHLNSDYGVEDSSLDRKYIVATGAASIVAGDNEFGTGSSMLNPVGGTPYLDGLIIPSTHVDFDFGTEPFIIEGWFKQEARPSTGPSYIWSMDVVNAAPCSIYVDTDGSLVGLLSGSAGTASASTRPGAISLNTWYWFTLTNVGNQISLHIDGLLWAGIQFATTPIAMESRLAVGRHVNDDPLLFNLQGRIGEVRITKGTPRYNYPSGPPPILPLADTLVTDPQYPQTLLLLHGNGLDGGILFPDSSSYNRVAAVVGTTGGVTTSTAQSVIGGSSLHFLGDAFLSFPAGIEALPTTTVDFTFETYFRFDSLAEPQYLFGIHAPGGIGDYVFAYITGDSISFAWASGVTYSFPNNSLTTNTWYWVCVSRQNGIVRMHLNDQILRTYDDVTVVGYTQVPDSISLGGVLDNHTGLRGYMAEARLTWKYGRYNNNIAPAPQPFCDGIPPPPPPPPAPPVALGSYIKLPRPILEVVRVVKVTPDYS